jgi:hypothetical protein
MGRGILSKTKHQRWIRSDVGNGDLAFKEDSTFQMGRGRLWTACSFDRGRRKHPSLDATKVLD